MPSVSEPPSTAAAAEALSAASHDGRSVSIERPGGEVTLSTRRLDRVLEHEAGDLTVTVEAGVHLRSLNEQLAEHGQQLSLDPPGDPTIGAVIAADLFGPRAYRFGRARDLLLGVTVVLADGTVASSGGKVVKNVAGYDLSKLFCGSAGRLGLIVRASFRLHPRLEAAGTVIVEPAGPEQAGDLARTVLRAPLAPSAADLLWPGRLALLFEGGPRAVGEQLKRAGKLLGGQEDGAVWDEAAERQRTATTRLAFGGAELGDVLGHLGGGALVRLGPTCFAFTAFSPPERLRHLDSSKWSPLAERVRRELDPEGILV